METSTQRTCDSMTALRTLFIYVRARMCITMDLAVTLSRRLLGRMVERETRDSTAKPLLSRCHGLPSPWRARRIRATAGVGPRTGRRRCSGSAAGLRVNPVWPPKRGGGSVVFGESFAVLPMQMLSTCCTGSKDLARRPELAALEMNVASGLVAVGRKKISKPPTGREAWGYPRGGAKLSEDHRTPTRQSKKIRGKIQVLPHPARVRTGFGLDRMDLVRF